MSKTKLSPYPIFSINLIESTHRNGIKTTVTAEAENPSRRTPYINKSNKISYVCFGGLVFSPLTYYDTAGFDG